jgi:transposase
MAGEFWLSDTQWAAIEPLLPRNQPGARRTDDRRVISGIVHVLKVGCRWQDCPAVYGPSTTVYNRFRRWTMRGLWRRLFEALTRVDIGDVLAIDSTTAKAHRSAAGGKGGPKRRRSAARGAGAQRKIHAIVDSCGRPIALEVTPGQLGDARVATALISAVPPGRSLAGDAAYDSDGLRRFLVERGTEPVIPNNPTRKRCHPFNEDAYRQRNLIERMFCRLKHWRRIATRYDKLASSFAAAVAIAAIIIWWT